jgi:arylsulfatase A-like enzyme
LNPANLEEFANRPGRQYGPQDQPFVDKWRLRYDEWIADADNSFGRFVSELDRTESSRNSVVMVSADHGESFEGGVWAHGGPNFVRQLVHVPLIVRAPGQTEGRSVSGVADQTAIAPTILDLAGLAIPDWMDGKSAKSWLDSDRDDGSMGVAFTQFIDESNSVFSPVRSGTVGAIADGHQYVLNIGSGNGALYRLAEANLQDNDISRMNPELAASMRALILSRFPEILRGAA